MACSSIGTLVIAILRKVCESKNSICQQFRELDWLGSIMIGDPLDCTSYYYCINGRAIESLCPNGLFYNPHTVACEVRGSVNFCQGIGPIITTPLPELTTREQWTTPSTTQTTVRVIFVSKSATTTESTTTQTETTTEETTTEATTTTTTTNPTTTTIETTTEEITEELTEEDTTLEPSTPSAQIEYPNCPEGVIGYFPMPYNARQLYTILLLLQGCTEIQSNYMYTATIIHSRK